jgi:hypothetical protein
MLICTSQKIRWQFYTDIKLRRFCYLAVSFSQIYFFLIELIMINIDANFIIIFYEFFFFY